ncbi:hypothetical protein BCD48_34795 [Pseudofrankia sp. BMG5.36]|nr:hypothetical protein BCD48_34795 [Pseudofrankia sp. BMG5.36]
MSTMAEDLAVEERARRRAEAAHWRAKAAAARARARALSWESDPELRTQVKAILALSPLERVLGLQAEAEVFARAILIRDRPGDPAGPRGGTGSRATT